MKLLAQTVLLIVLSLFGIALAVPIQTEYVSTTHEYSSGYVSSRRCPRTQSAYYTRQGALCPFRLNFQQIPYRALAPDFCYRERIRSYSGCSYEVATFCRRVFEVCSSYSEYGEYYSLTILRELYKQYHSYIPSYEPLPNYYTQDVFRGCLPYDMLPVHLRDRIIRGRPSAPRPPPLPDFPHHPRDPLPRILPLPEICYESHPYCQEKPVRKFCKKMRKVKALWDEFGGEKYCRKLSKVWRKFEHRVKKYFYGPIPKCYYDCGY